MMDKPEPAVAGDLLMVVDKMPEGVWGYIFETEPRPLWLIRVEKRRMTRNEWEDSLETATDIVSHMWCFSHDRQDTINHKMWASYNHAYCEVKRVRMVPVRDRK